MRELNDVAVQVIRDTDTARGVCPEYVDITETEFESMRDELYLCDSRYMQRPFTHIAGAKIRIVKNA